MVLARKCENRERSSDFTMKNTVLIVLRQSLHRKITPKNEHLILFCRVTGFTGREAACFPSACQADT
jgi:hypothetical protein